jgi:hypothetical protein
MIPPSRHNRNFSGPQTLFPSGGTIFFNLSSGFLVVGGGGGNNVVHACICFGSLMN